MVRFIKNYIVIALAVLVTVFVNVDGQLPGGWAPETSTTGLNQIKTLSNNGNLSGYPTQPAIVLNVWSAFKQIVAGTKFKYWALVRLSKKKLIVCNFEGIRYPNTNYIHITYAKCYDCNQH